MQTKKSKKRTRVFDSMAQCAAVTGISKEQLQHIKNKGCPAFRGSRIHESDLWSWIDHHSRQGTPDQLIEAEVHRRLEDISWRMASLHCYLSVTLEDNPGVSGTTLGDKLRETQRLVSKAMSGVNAPVEKPTNR